MELFDMSSRTVARTYDPPKLGRCKMPLYQHLTSSRRGTLACSCNYLTDLIERCWTAFCLLDRKYDGGEQLAEAVLCEVEAQRRADPLAEGPADFHASRYATRAFIQECIENVAAGIERCNRCPDPDRGPWPLLDGHAIEQDLRCARQYLLKGRRHAALDILSAREEQTSQRLIKGHGHVIRDPALERIIEKTRYQGLSMAQAAAIEEEFHRAVGNKGRGIFE